MRGRILVIEPVDIAEDHRSVRFHQARDQGAQRVVVAEADLLDGNGVVLVDDGNHVQLQQAQQRIAGMQVRGAVLRIVACQQDAGRQQALARKRLGIAPRQLDGAHGCRSLQGRRIRRTLLHAQGLQPARDGAARHYDGFHALRAQGGQLGREILQICGIDAPGGVRERRSAHLHHQHALRCVSGIGVHCGPPLLIDVAHSSSNPSNSSSCVSGDSYSNAISRMRTSSPSRAPAFSRARSTPMRLKRC